MSDVGLSPYIESASLCGEVVEKMPSFLGNTWDEVTSSSFGVKLL